MKLAQAFEPRWASPPGETVLSALRAKGLTVEDLADELRLADAVARGIITGATPISQELATGLATVLGPSPEFWLRRESSYQESLHWLSIDAVASCLPMQHMVEYGWIDTPRSWKDAARACLSFFDVVDVNEWRSLYGDEARATHFRASDSFSTNAIALSAWIRQAERLTHRDATGEWNRSGFTEVLSQLRSLTKEADPQKFLPILRDLCARQGVSVIVLRAPTGVPVSGVARRDRHGRPMILLSARHLTDDHFWFTFFHEAAHVLLHDLGEDFVDSMEPGSADEDAREREANEFARVTLVPGGVGGLGEHRARGPQMRDVLRFAASLNVAPGIVVGQLQHSGRIGFNQLNRLRRRYRWDGPTLKT